MRRHELEHLIRAAAAVTNESELDFGRHADLLRLDHKSQ